MDKPRRESRKNPDVLLLRPATELGWELWATAPGAPREVSRFETLPDLEKRNLRAVALPADTVLVISRWLQTTEDAVLPEMVAILLERQGLMPREEGGKTFSLTPVLREENRTLVAIRLLGAQVPIQLCQPQVERFEVSADLQPLVGDGLTLWREGGRLVGAFSRAGSLIHLQSFHEGVLSQSIVLELFCTRLQLETEEILGSEFAISLIGDFSEEEASLLTAIIGTLPQFTSVVTPVLPAAASGLTPPMVEVQRQRIRTRQRIERVVLSVAGIYALLLIGLILNVAWLSFSNRRVAKATAADQPTVDAIRSTAARWNSMEDAINPAIYPLEVLFQSASLLPEDGVRFTLFQGRDRRVTISGEANSVAVAFKLGEDFKGKTELAYFDWTMPSPKTDLPNDRAGFEITGEPPRAQAY
ncbi:MAG TPA: hypothetical protein VF585_01140 [Chthoniobacterales bacterium]